MWSDVINTDIKKKCLKLVISKGFWWDVGTYLQTMWQQWPEVFKTAIFWDVKSNSMACSYGGMVVPSYKPAWQQRPGD
jgi:hypothetical protein